MNEAVAEVAQAVARMKRERPVEEMGDEAPALRAFAPLRHEWIGIDVMGREPRLHHRDQRRDSGERKLEADAENRLRLDRDDGKHREGEIAHGQRAPVHDHRAEHDQRHDERPLGADARAGRDIVEERAGHGDQSRPFLDRIAERKRRRQRQQPARHDEENPRHQRHLHAGNGDDVEDAGLADEVLGVVGEEVALARHHRRRDRAFVAADDRIDPEREAVARLVDRSMEALAQGRVARRRQKPDRPERRADRADAGEKRVAGEVVSARQRRVRGREQARLELDIVARGDDRAPFASSPGRGAEPSPAACRRR